MVKSIAPCSWLMAMTRLMSACPSCVPRLASCPRSLSCLTAASQRTSSTATTCGKSAWMRSSPPPRKPSFTTSSCHFLRYPGRLVCNGECGVDSEAKAEQVKMRFTLSVLRKQVGNKMEKGEQANTSRAHEQNQGHNRWSGKWQQKRGWYILYIQYNTLGLTRDSCGLMCERGAGVQVSYLTTRSPPKCH